MHVDPQYQPLLREIGLDADAVFDHPDIRVWRSIRERENCTLDSARGDGSRVRLHIKRHRAVRGRSTPADEEAAGIRLLQQAGIATTPLVAWGRIKDGRSFLITAALAEHRAGDKLVEAGMAFERLLAPTAELAAKLHGAGLHHRDLYLCHFFSRGEEPLDLRLIDAARVRRLPAWPMRRRWVVKDLAQFWYSTLKLPVTDEQRERWLEIYGQRSGEPVGTLRRAVERKARWIGRHDAKLKNRQPGRDVSLEEGTEAQRRPREGGEGTKGEDDKGTEGQRHEGTSMEGTKGGDENHSCPTLRAFLPSCLRASSLKIALVILHADPAKGGAERYTIDLAGSLVRRGHEVSLVATSFAQVPGGVRQVKIEAPGWSRLGQYRRFLAALDRHLDETPYDIVHAMLPVRRCDVYHPHAGVAAEAIESGHLKYRSELGRTSALWFNRINRKRRRFARVERELLMGDRPPVTICLSDYVKRTVRRHYPLADEQLATLFNAVDLSKYDPAARPEAGAAVRSKLRISLQPAPGVDGPRRGPYADGRVVALMIAQDFERKGLREAIEALVRVGDERLALVVVGRPDPRAYRRLAESLGVGERVIFAGATNDPYSFYSAADFFVLPTRHDPCSLVVLEALAMGVPVISTIHNGACEIMSEGEHGFVLQDPSDIQRLAEAMRAMLDEPARRRMSEACLSLRPRLSDEVHVGKLLGIYERSMHHTRKYVTSEPNSL